MRQEKFYADHYSAIEGNDFFDRDFMEKSFRYRCHFEGWDMGDVSDLPFQFLAGVVWFAEMKEMQEDAREREREQGELVTS